MSFCKILCAFCTEILTFKTHHAKAMNAYILCHLYKKTDLNKKETDTWVIGYMGTIALHKGIVS